MKVYISLFILAWVLSTTLGQDVGQIVDGPCSRFSSSNQQPFFKKLLMGTWYVYASYDYPDILGLDCLVAFYRLTPDGNAMNTENGKNLLTNARKTFQSNFHFDRPGVGYYTYKAGSVTQGVDIPATDYIRYYIEFACVDIAGGKSDCYIGIFTRLPIPSILTLSRINAFLDTHQIDRTKLRYVVHDKMRYEGYKVQRSRKLARIDSLNTKIEWLFNYRNNQNTKLAHFAT